MRRLHIAQARQRRESHRPGGRKRASPLPFRFGVQSWLVVALLLALLIYALTGHSGGPKIPSFYSHRGKLPDRAGVLLRHQVLGSGTPAGTTTYRILYTTTGLGGRVTTASGVVIVSDRGTSVPRPVILWEHGTTGIAQQCAPSLSSNPLGDGGFPAVGSVISKGWAIVAPDYLGLGTAPPHPYLVGRPEADSSLDAVRAARSLASLDLGQRTVVWGYSQGGGDALWTGLEAHRYAPEVPLSGVAAVAPASDVLALMRATHTNGADAIFDAYTLFGYSYAYSDVKVAQYLRPGAIPAVRHVLDSCLDQTTSVPVSAHSEVFSRRLTTGPLGRRLAQNDPSSRSGVPTLIAQGTADTIISVSVQTAFASRLCSTGQQLEYRTYKGATHVSIMSGGSRLIPYLLSWTAARFRGSPPPSDCIGFR